VTKWVEEDTNEKEVFWPSEELKKKAWVSDESIYEEAAAKLFDDAFTTKYNGIENEGSYPLAFLGISPLC